MEGALRMFPLLLLAFFGLGLAGASGACAPEIPAASCSPSSSIPPGFSRRLVGRDLPSAALMAGGVQRLRGGSGFRGMWGNSGGGYSEPRISNEDLKKNVQRVLEKHPSGVMGRDLRRLYKEVNAKELPVEDFGVQRPIELVEKELSDTVYYTR